MLPTFLLCLLIAYLPIPIWFVDITPLWSLAGVAALTLLNLALWQVVARVVTREPGKGFLSSFFRVPLFVKAIKFSIIVFTFLYINLFQWGGLIDHLVSEWIFIPLLPDIVLLLPVVLMVVNAMACEGRVYRGGRRPEKTFCGGGTRAWPGLFSYLVLRFRTELGIILLPWALLTAVFDVISFVFGANIVVEVTVSAVLVVSLILYGPFMLRFLWNVEPLPDGPIRRRLREFGDVLNFKCSDIFLWHTRMHIPNAAIIGFTGLLRYVFLSDVLMAHFTENEIESIFAHEIGHIKGKHFFYYFSMIIAFGASLTALAVLYSSAGMPTGGVLFFSDTASHNTSFLVLAYAVFYWGGFFGCVSRRFELEADVFCIENTTSPESYISALEKIAYLGGGDRRKTGWRHFSIQRRVECLRSALKSGETARYFRSAVRLKVLIVAITVVSGGIIFLAP